MKDEDRKKRLRAKLVGAALANGFSTAAAEDAIQALGDSADISLMLGWLEDAYPDESADLIGGPK